MARVIDLKNATIIGTREQIQSLLAGLKEAAVVDAKFAKLVVSDTPIDGPEIIRRLKPRAKKKT